MDSGSIDNKPGVVLTSEEAAECIRRTRDIKSLIDDCRRILYPVLLEQAADPRERLQESQLLMELIDILQMLQTLKKEINL